MSPVEVLKITPTIASARSMENILRDADYIFRIANRTTATLDYESSCFMFVV